MNRKLLLACPGVLVLLASCQAPDGRALQKMACEQAAASLDMQSVSQLDALRKALGVAPDVDPISYCRSLGAAMEPGQPGATNPDANPKANPKANPEAN